MLRCTDFVLRYVGFRHFAAYPFLTEIGFEMYFGSVKFFKHLIYTVFLVWLAAATVLAVVFGILYGAEKKKSADTADTDVHNSVVSEEAEHISLQQHYVNMTADGYTAEDILDFIRENAAASFDSYISALPAESNDAEPAEDTAKPAEGDVMSADNSAEYTKLYPELYANAPEDFTVSDKVIYLTFDDGPSENTVDILSILDKYDIKATFFMCGGDDDRTKEIMKLVADKGHKIGIHSKSHNYTEIYASVESFLADMNDTYTNIYEATGVEPEVKEQAEQVLDRLGIPMSNAVGMFLRQIVLQRGIPFEMKLPAYEEPVAYGSLTKEQFNAEMEKGMEDIKAGRVYSADEVEAEMKREFGI